MKKLYELDREKIEKVVFYFEEHTTGTATDIDVNGRFLTSLVTRGYLKITGHTEEFICIDSCDDVYKKYLANIYAIDSRHSLWDDYTHQEIEDKKLEVEYARKHLKEKEEELATLMQRLEEEYDDEEIESGITFTIIQR